MMMNPAVPRPGRAGGHAATAQLDQMKALGATALSWALHDSVAAGGEIRPDQFHETIAALIELAALGAHLCRCSLPHLEREISRAVCRVAPLETAGGPLLADAFAAGRTGRAMLGEIARLRSAGPADLEALAVLNNQLRRILPRLAGYATGRQ